MDCQPLNPTATLDDTEPSLADHGQLPTHLHIHRQQGYVCPSDPAAYTNGVYTYNESNTAVLTYSDRL